MTKETTRKDRLLADIEEGWTNLNSFLDTLTHDQTTVLRDPQGWSVKDHITHMTAWERSILLFLQNQPQHVGLEVDETLFSNQSEDEINAVIFQRNKDIPLADVLRNFHRVHQLLLSLLASFNDADLLRPNSFYVPDGSEEEDDSHVLDLVNGNTCEHFREHLSWIKTLIERGGKARLNE